MLESDQLKTMELKNSYDNLLDQIMQLKREKNDIIHTTTNKLKGYEKDQSSNDERVAELKCHNESLRQCHDELEDKICIMNDEINKYRTSEQNDQERMESFENKLDEYKEMYRALQEKLHESQEKFKASQDIAAQSIIALEKEKALQEKLDAKKPQIMNNELKKVMAFGCDKEKIEVLSNQLEAHKQMLRNEFKRPENKPLYIDSDTESESGQTVSFFIIILIG